MYRVLGIIILGVIYLGFQGFSLMYKNKEKIL